MLYVYECLLSRNSNLIKNHLYFQKRLHLHSAASSSLITALMRKLPKKRKCPTHIHFHSALVFLIQIIQECLQALRREVVQILERLFQNEIGAVSHQLHSQHCFLLIALREEPQLSVLNPLQSQQLQKSFFSSFSLSQSSEAASQREHSTD